jgi:hypothetical protein
VETIEVRRFQIRVPRAGQIAQPLVVGEDEDDVRTTAREGLGFRSETKACDGEEEEQEQVHLVGVWVGVKIGGGSSQKNPPNFKELIARQRVLSCRPFERLRFGIVLWMR